MHVVVVVGECLYNWEIFELTSMQKGIFLKRKVTKCANFLFMCILFKLNRNSKNYLEFIPRNNFQENFTTGLAQNLLSHDYSKKKSIFQLILLLFLNSPQFIPSLPAPGCSSHHSTFGIPLHAPYVFFLLFLPPCFLIVS